MSDETYVYDGVEVKKTGRTAVRKIARAWPEGTTAGVHVLYEIQPVDKDLDWKKWVDDKALYQVITSK